ncbi:polysaccharide pyruvyl transferase family protein [Photobacterium piscicola]|uniref:polysaccharide pyruvyl transferase family protein n=1 Tax=Photobacterium piscicola TaxID=1378299 RepID=UPI002E1877A2|nr:polysaccharide pyruvyl transferase family protein [Photobacterium piscicola]
MKIAICGPLADRNLGDYGMFINNLYEMGNNNDYFVFSYNSSFVNQLKCDYLNDFNISFTDVVLKKKETDRKSLYESIKKARRILLGIECKNKYIPTPFELINRCININDIESELDKCDVLIVSGGGYFNDLWFEWERNDDLFKIIIPILIAAKKNKKIIFTANGYGPFDNSNHFYEIIFKEAQHAIYGCRDNKLSEMYLSSVGVNNAIQLPDDLYIINERLNKYNEVKFSNYIIFEQYGNVENLKNNIEKIKELVIFYKMKNTDFVFLTFDQDYSTIEYLNENIKEDNFHIYEFENGYLKIEEAILLIKNAKLVICNRYHALVLAVTNKVPVLNIMKPVYDLRYYYNKNIGLLDKAFDGLYYNANTFIKGDIEMLIDSILDEKNTDINVQKELYDSKIFAENKIKLTGQRLDFMRKTILGDK